MNDFHDLADTFHREGFAAAPDIIDRSHIDCLITDFESVIDGLAQDLMDDGSISESYESEPFDARIAHLSRAAGRSLQSQVSFPTNLSQAIFKFLHDDGLLDAIESLVGPEIYCNPTQHVRPKLPDSMEVSDWSGRSPVHQDAAVLLPEADQTLVVTSWIPLVDATRKNGTLNVYPKRHEGPILPHERCPYGWTVTESENPPEEPLTIEMEKGGVIFIHGRTPHGSGPNRTERVRWSLDLRWHDARKPGGRPLPGMLVRSREHDVTTYDQWLSAWETARRDTRPRKMYRW
ncbi:MAG: hypothetical protein HOH43_00795 [Candidatus Latescibacteria bacterium]|nr:hypothetical protein [Candidatus Latescibacterota bacterium]